MRCVGGFGGRRTLFCIMMHVRHLLLYAANGEMKHVASVENDRLFLYIFKSK